MSDNPQGTRNDDAMKVWRSALGSCGLDADRCSSNGHARAARVIAEHLALLPDDVRRLVIAARVVAFEDQGAEALRELDQASEVFADRVPWDDEAPARKDAPNA